MLRLSGFLLLGSLVPLLGLGTTLRVSDGPSYTADSQLRFPADYRTWVFLSSGLNMSYDAKAASDGHDMFNNVFVNPEAYRVYEKTGHWPEGTALVLENRGGETGRSINKAGRTQSAELMGLEVHVLDTAYLDHNQDQNQDHNQDHNQDPKLDPRTHADGWAFYSFDNKVSAKLIPRSANCYSCHEQHAAVDTTFVQFYPTLLEAAEKNHSFSAVYSKEISSPAK